MNLTEIISLTKELIAAFGPCGQEEAVRQIVQRELQKTCDEVWVDGSENVVGVIRAESTADHKTPSVQLAAHMDEISMIVKRVEPDGTLSLRNMGGIKPWVFGLGPVSIMGDIRTIEGVLSVGPLHSTPETPKAWRSKVVGGGLTLDWPQIHVFTRLSAEQVAAAGVHAGTRVVIHPTRRHLIEIEDCLCGHFIDDRALLAVMLATAARIKASGKRPPADIYFAGTCSEEIAAGPATNSAYLIKPDAFVALEIGPAIEEFGTLLSGDPIILYRDARTLYSKPLCDKLVKAGKSRGMQPQCAIFENYGTDAGFARSAGFVGQASVVAIPTDNTHGFEITPKAALENITELLVAYLEQPF